MDTTTPNPIVRAHDECQQSWFAGGGVMTWLATADETGGAFLLFEDEMAQGKVTPLHTHPTEETMYVLEGEICYHIDGQERTVSAGGVVMAPRGVPHAFMVVSEAARMLCLHTPGSTQEFYRGASEAITAAHPASGVVDFDRIRESGERNGGIEILGPPPFTKP